MVQRVTNHKSTSYSYYGGKGITVDNVWLDFKQFKLDMEDTWFTGASLDRLDNSKGYTKENCRWATDTEQSVNRSSNYQLIYEGREYTVKELAKYLGININTLRGKLNRHKGVPIEEIVKTMLAGTYTKIVPAEHINKRN